MIILTSTYRMNSSVGKILRHARTIRLFSFHKGTALQHTRKERDGDFARAEELLHFPPARAELGEKTATEVATATANLTLFRLPPHSLRQRVGRRRGKVCAFRGDGDAPHSLEAGKGGDDDDDDDGKEVAEEDEGGGKRTGKMSLVFSPFFTKRDCARKVEKVEC